MRPSIRFSVRWGLALSLLLLLALTAVAQVGVVATVEQDLTLRVGPGVEWRRLAILPAGTNIALEGRDTTGSWVRGITQNSDVGWVAARYLNIAADVVFALPVVEREAPITVPVPPPGSVPVEEAAPAEESAPESSAPAAVEGGTVTTASANVNMRSGPGTSYNRVGGLRSGEQINLDGRDGTLSWARGINAEGVVGWVAVNYLNIGYNELAALPVVGVDTPFGLAAPGGGPAPAPEDSAAPAPPIVSNTPITGFGYGGHVRGLSDSTVNAMRSAGMTWAKYQVRFTPGDNPAALAGLIADAHAKGFRIMLGIVGHAGDVLAPGYYDTYAAYVGGVAAQGADAIEVWNEQNIDREWAAGNIDPGAYTQLLARAYNAIKANNPNTLVISGAPAPTGFFGGCSANGCDDNVYISGMAAAGAANYMDCIGVHYNEGIVPPTQTFGDPRSDYYTRYYQSMVSTYYNAFGGRRPLCFTELGYLTPEGYGPLPGAFAWAANVTVAQQAAWLGQVVDIARSSGIVRVLIVWNVDFRQYGADPMAGYAIIRPDGSCPACAAMGN